MVGIYVGGVSLYSGSETVLAGGVSDLPEVREPCAGEQYSPDQLAEFFHRTYEKLAPRFNYETKEESRTAWENLAPNHRQLMRAVAQEVLEEFFPKHVLWQ